MCCHQSAVAIEDHQYLHILQTIQACRWLAHSERGLLPGATGHCHVSPAVVYTWWISTQMALQSDICCCRFYAHKWMSTEMALQSGIICCYLTSFTHTIERPQKRLSNQEIICCSLTSFMDTTECPQRWHCNQKSSVAVSSVLCTQASLHWDGIAIRNHLLPSHHVLRTQVNLHRGGISITNYLLLSRQFYAILSVSHHLYAHK